MNHISGKTKFSGSGSGRWANYWANIKENQAGWFGTFRELASAKTPTVGGAIVAKQINSGSDGGLLL